MQRTSDIADLSNISRFIGRGPAVTHRLAEASFIPMTSFKLDRNIMPPEEAWAAAKFEPVSTFRDAPRMSGQPTHAHLSKTVRRLRRADPLPIRLRIARRRVFNGADRLFNASCTIAVFGIVGYVIVPAAFTAATRWQW